jgi:hypothetical protein
VRNCRRIYFCALLHVEKEKGGSEGMSDTQRERETKKKEREGQREIVNERVVNDSMVETETNKNEKQPFGRVPSIGH